LHLESTTMMETTDQLITRLIKEDKITLQEALLLSAPVYSGITYCSPTYPMSTGTHTPQITYTTNVNSTETK